VSLLFFAIAVSNANFKISQSTHPILLIFKAAKTSWFTVHYLQ
jgi:hypothetical protein